MRESLMNQVRNKQWFSFGCRKLNQDAQSYHSDQSQTQTTNQSELNKHVSSAGKLMLMGVGCESGGIFILTNYTRA